MAESALQKLIRLKKERENGTASLETVQGQVPEVGSGTALATINNDTSSGGVVLSEEGIHSDGCDASVTSSSEPTPEPAVVPEVVPEVPVEQPKPMSAMDRLRALKSGGVKPNVGQTSANNLQHTSNATINLVDSEVVDGVVKKEVPVTPTKPRKTHPIAMEMAELEQALDAQVPGFVSILSQIHKKLRADPDVVTLLDDEEIAVIVAGLEKHTNVTIVAPSAIKAAKSKAKKEPVSAMDL